MPESSVLYDGWSLAFHPNSPAAIHLQILLVCHPAEVQAYLALPATPHEPVPSKINPIQVMGAPSEKGRLIWEQKTIPDLAKKLEVDLLHLATAGPALFATPRCLLSPTDSLAPLGLADALQDWPLSTHKKGVLSRLGESLEQGGLSRVHAIIWPADLPRPAVKQLILPLPPSLIPASWAQPDPELAIDLLDLPNNFILSHGNFSEQEIRRLLEAWSWAADSIGEYHPLLVLGLRPEFESHLEELVCEYGLNGTVKGLGNLSARAIVELYSRCSAVFHSGPLTVWGNSLRLAISMAKPIVAIESRLADSLVGPAAYLVKPSASLQETCRALGAALVTIIVEEGVSNQLKQAASRQAASWQSDSPDWEEGFSRALFKLYVQAAR